MVDTDSEFTANASNADNWGGVGRDFALTRHSLLTEINRDNVKNLKMSWAGVRAVSGRIASGNEDGQVDNAEAGEPAPGRIGIGTAGYGLVDLHARWKLSERLSLFARVDNVFNRRYATYAAVAEDVFPDGELARPQDAPVEAGPARFLATGVPLQYLIGLRWNL